MTPSDQVQTFLECLLGRKLVTVERGEFHWAFKFENAATLVTECPWRILSHDNITLSSLDDGEKFGLTDAVDAQKMAGHSIVGKSVHEAYVREVVGDLMLNFGEGVLFEALNVSSGYEAWQLTRTQGGTLISMGGGKLALV